MKSLHIRDVDERVLDRLHRLARLHHRSVQGEVRAILEEAASFAPEGAVPLTLVTVDTGQSPSWSRSEMYGGEAR
ncbi:MAG: FitA-like ribbon-helix-helix domain-containing protein [Spirochaetales bacterium]